MQIEQLKIILKKGNVEEMEDALEAFPKEEINEDIFEIFVELLFSADEDEVLLALCSINLYCPDLLRINGERMASTLVDLLSHDSQLIMCFADQAIDIIEEYGLNELLNRYPRATTKMKFQILWSITRKDELKNRKEEVVNLLLDDLDSKEKMNTYNDSHLPMYLSTLYYYITDKLTHYNYAELHEKFLFLINKFKENEAKLGYTESYYQLLCDEWRRNKIGM